SARHGAYCGLAYRAGSGALMGDLDKTRMSNPTGKRGVCALSARHGAYCGLAYRAGSGALMGDLDKTRMSNPT
ncbi:hypothetical protein QWT36_23830, partial [Salmonella enterica subsp. enterica serovar Typhi]|nr:hypothetical protein [Salmonella enterica subsp. enterica serovar Typhi]